MTLKLEPVRVGNGYDEDGLLVFDEDQRLIAVLTRLSDQHEIAAGQWFLEAGFGLVNSHDHPIFANLDSAQDWVLHHLIRRD